MKVNVKSIIFFIVMIAAFVAVISLVGTPGAKNEALTWQDVTNKFENNEVTEINPCEFDKYLSEASWFLR